MRFEHYVSWITYDHVPTHTHIYIYIYIYIYTQAYTYIEYIFTHTLIQTDRHRHTDRRTDVHTYILIVATNAKQEKTFKIVRQTKLLFHIAKYQYLVN